MTTINWNKLLVLVLVNAGVTYLAGSGTVSGDAATAIYAGSLGYVFGNGHALVSKKE